jgi:glycogen(starch) synthase
MRILMTTDAVGGVWTYSLQLVEGLADQGVEVVLAIFGPPPSREQRRHLRRSRVAAYGERTFALEWMENPWRDLDEAGSWLLELDDSVRPDVVHLNGYSFGALHLSAPKLVVGHSCALSWHEAVRKRPAGAEWARYRHAVRRGLAAADAVVAPTNAMLHDLVRLYRPECPCSTIPNGLAAGGLAPLEKEPFVLGVGRAWDEAKNLQSLERIAGRLPWPIVVAGDGGALGRVTGKRLRHLYGHASIFAAPAKYEPFGLAALEAGLAGCALVLGDIASLREVWDEAAAFVDPFDDDALEWILARLIADDGLLSHHAAAARRRAIRFPRERMAAAYHDLYQRLVAAADTSISATAELVR